MNKCEICGYRWKGRKEKPKQCPQCKRYKWDVKRYMLHKNPKPVKELLKEYEDKKELILKKYVQDK